VLALRTVCRFKLLSSVMGDVVQNLIDLAGSESSKTETTGLRRKEGSFINKSLLTLGTVNFLFSFFLSFHESRKHCSPLSICLVSLQEVVLFFIIMLCSWMVIAINMCDVVGTIMGQELEFRS
jgi:hypothetical protein